MFCLVSLGFNGQKLQDDLFKAFGPGTIYEEARNQTSKPRQGPWTNHCVVTMLTNKSSGVSPAGDKDSKDPDGLCKAIVLAGLLGGCGKCYDDEVSQCVETCQVRNLETWCVKSNLLLIATKAIVGKERVNFHGIFNQLCCSSSSHLNLNWCYLKIVNFLFLKLSKLFLFNFVLCVCVSDS